MQGHIRVRGLRVRSNDGVPCEGVWMGNLVEHLARVAQVGDDGIGAAELDNDGCGKWVVVEMGAVELGVDLEEVVHGIA